jgi:hypothetical protein
MENFDNKNDAKPVMSANILDKIIGSQTQVNLNNFQPILLVENLLILLKDRDQDILRRRFGLDGIEADTLETIGKKYNLTRERVRQIEKDSLVSLKGKNIVDLDSALQLIFDTITEHGNIMSEDFLLQTLLVNKPNPKERQAIKFLLSLGTRFKYFKESKNYYESWYLVGFNLTRLEEVVIQFSKILESEKKVMSEPELYARMKTSDYYSTHQMELTDKVLKSYLNIAKNIQINPFNEIGLMSWTEVKPRDVGDKAYLILKHHGKPEHYSAITKMINEHKFDQRTAFQETVHNELIKDNRFVLIGRGIYALSEWGYKKGVVADVIKEILLAANRPLTRDEIIHEVLKKRQVKRNTILVGLSNHKLFQKAGKDRYAFVGQNLDGV